MTKLSNQIVCTNEVTLRRMERHFREKHTRSRPSPVWWRVAMATAYGITYGGALTVWVSLWL